MRTEEEKLHDFISEKYDKQMPAVESFLDRNVKVSRLVDLISDVVEFSMIKSISLQTMNDMKQKIRH